MNQKLKTFAQTQRDPVQKAGLLKLAALTSDDFLNLPVLPSDRFSQDGLFYQLPCTEHATFTPTHTKRVLLTIHCIQHHMSTCQLRIELDIDPTGHLTISIVNPSAALPEPTRFAQHSYKTLTQLLEIHAQKAR